MTLSLLYMTDVAYGGFASYATHLYRALAAQGVAVRLHKVGKRLESRIRSFHGVPYQNVPVSYAEQQRNVLVVCAYWKHNPNGLERILRAGAALVVHDPTELSPELTAAVIKYRTRVIAIRAGNVAGFSQRGLSNVRFVPHPYVRAQVSEERQRHAVSLSRLDYDKHCDVILEANALLPQGRRCEIWGACNRLYVHHKLGVAFPDWEQSYKGHFAKTLTAAVELAASARWVVDMSVIKGDGGGSQYTFLEAWDAGTPLIIHRQWAQPGGEMAPGTNCLAAGSPAELAQALGPDGAPRLVEGGLRSLEAHAPSVVVPKLLEALA